MDLMRDYWAGRVRDAEAGDRHAGREILLEILDAIKERNANTWAGPIPWEYASYLARCLEQIVDFDIDPTEALHLKPKRHRERDPKRDSQESDWALQAARYKRAGVPVPEAIAKVAAQVFGDGSDEKGFETVRRAYYKHRLSAELVLRLEAGDKTV